MEARSRYLQAKELELARSVTDRLSNFLVRRGFYDGVRQLNAELLNYGRHPTPMNWIARTCLHQGEYDSAQIWYQRSIDVSANLNQKEVGVALHGIATIDMRKGEYDAAREDFEKAMKIRQQIGDRAGEAATFHQLGILSWERGPTQDGLRPLAISYLINSSIGHWETKTYLENLSAAASQLSFSQEQFDALLKEVAEAYRTDRCQGLIDAAFLKDRS